MAQYFWLRPLLDLRFLPLIFTMDARDSLLVMAAEWLTAVYWIIPSSNSTLLWTMPTLPLRIRQHQPEKSWIQPLVWLTDSLSTALLPASIKRMPSRLGSLPLSTTHLLLCPWIQLLTWLPMVPSKCIVTTYWWLSTIHQPTLTRHRLKISLVFSIRSSLPNLIWLETSIEMVPVVSSLPMALLFGPKLLSPSSCHSNYISI